MNKEKMEDRKKKNVGGKGRVGQEDDGSEEEINGKTGRGRGAFCGLSDSPLRFT